MGVFGVFGFEKLASRGGIKKQFAHFDGGADRMRRRAAGVELAVHGADALAVAAVGAAAGEGEPRHGSDTGQAFTAKAHAGDVFQIIEAGDFAGGMAGKRQSDVVGVDAAAVVGDADELDAAACQLDVDVGCACVDAVFNDFFQRIGGALHHFAGGDLVDKMVGQGGDAFHAGAFENGVQTACIIAYLPSLFQTAFFNINTVIIERPRSLQNTFFLENSQ